MHPWHSASVESSPPSCRESPGNWAAGNHVSDEFLIRKIGETNRDSQVVASSQLSNLTNAPEASSHHNSLVSKLLIVIEDLLNALDTRIFLGAVVLLVRCLVPVQNTANKRRDEESTSLGCGNGLGQREHEGQVAVHTMLGLQDMGCFDTLPRRSELYQDTRLVDADVFVKLKNVSV